MPHADTPPFPSTGVSGSSTPPSKLVARRSFYFRGLHDNMALPARHPLEAPQASFESLDVHGIQVAERGRSSARIAGVRRPNIPPSPGPSGCGGEIFFPAHRKTARRRFRTPVPLPSSLCGRMPRSSKTTEHACSKVSTRTQRPPLSVALG